MSNDNDQLSLVKKMILAAVTIVFLILGAQAIRHLANR